MADSFVLNGQKLQRVKTETVTTVTEYTLKELRAKKSELIAQKQQIVDGYNKRIAELNLLIDQCIALKVPEEIIMEPFTFTDISIA